MSPCSQELFFNEISQIKLLLNKNGSERVDGQNNYNKNLNKRTTCRKLLNSSYFAAQPRIIFLSRPLLTPGGKDPIAKLKKSMVIYHFDCFSEANYIEMTSRQLKKRVKEHIPKRIKRNCISKEKKTSSEEIQFQFRKNDIFCFC